MKISSVFACLFAKFFVTVHAFRMSIAVIYRIQNYKVQTGLIGKSRSA